MISTPVSTYKKIELALGDITKEHVDAIVNAANSGLRGGGGVDGAIHRAAGVEIMKECRRIGHCEPGDAVITGAGKLPARFVIHAVGPVWKGGGANEELLLASCYEKALELAREHGCRTISFPAISTGAYGYPPERAAPVALAATAEALERLPLIEKVRFVFVDERLLEIYRRAFAQLSGSESELRLVPGDRPDGFADRDPDGAA
jgi:O-acetyl-ADP-ribose deacetylase (regulator of RNase III)